ncbi:MAG: hypothetical protein ACXWKA_12365 [Xanthobacteraceae bacterium]
MAKKEKRWQIKVLRGKTATLVGIVAPDADAAIKHAIKDLAIEPALHSRLIAREMI